MDRTGKSPKIVFAPHKKRFERYFVLSTFSMGRVIRGQRKGRGSIFKTCRKRRKGAAKLRALDYAERHGYLKVRPLLYMIIYIYTVSKCGNITNTSDICRV